MINFFESCTIPTDSTRSTELFNDSKLYFHRHMDHIYYLYICALKLYFIQLHVHPSTPILYVILSQLLTPASCKIHSENSSFPLPPPCSLKSQMLTELALSFRHISIDGRLQDVSKFITEIKEPVMCRRV